MTRSSENPTLFSNVSRSFDQVPLIVHVLQLGQHNCDEQLYTISWTIVTEQLK